MSEGAPAVANLPAALEGRAEELARRATDAMYADPFWEDRFGARGRRFALEDGRYHVAYLAEALRGGGAELLEGYARWLQGVLVTRGMCSRHLADHFARLSDAIRGADVPEASHATRLLDRAALALRRAGPAGALQAREDAIASRVADELGARGGDGAGAARAAVARDAAHLTSYLADAVALDRPALFAAHVSWMRGHAERQGRGVRYLDDLLAALRVAIDAEPSDPRTAALAVLDAATQPPMGASA